MSDPLISVVIPAYNHERFVQDTIRSIMAQTYQNLELIMIDDGSKDKTWEKIQEIKTDCEKRFVNLSLNTQENQGTCKTLNRLISQVKGEYVYLIASDDVAKPRAIETLYQAVAGKNYVLAVGNEDFITSDGERTGVDEEFRLQPLDKAKYKTFCDFYDKATKENYYRSGEFGSYASFLKRNYIPNGYLMLASALKSFSYTKDAPLEDWFTHLQLSKRGEYKFVDEVLFSYRLHGNNTICDRRHLWEMSKKTLEYEENLCNHNPELQKIFRKLTINKKYFNLGFMRGYQRKILNKKLYCLNLLGKEFVLREKRSAMEN